MNPSGSVQCCGAGRCTSPWPSSSAQQSLPLLPPLPSRYSGGGLVLVLMHWRPLKRAVLPVPVHRRRDREVVAAQWLIREACCWMKRCPSPARLDLSLCSSRLQRFEPRLSTGWMCSAAVSGVLERALMPSLLVCCLLAVMNSCQLPACCQRKGWSPALATHKHAMVQHVCALSWPPVCSGS